MVGVHPLSQLPSPSTLTELRHLCHAPQSRPSAPAFPTNLGLDKDLPESGLARGKVHEWLGVLPPESPSPPTKEKTQEKTQEKTWSPPLSLLIHLAHSALAQADNTQARVVWIARPAASGFSVRPYSPALGARPSTSTSAGPGAEPRAEPGAGPSAGPSASPRAGPRAGPGAGPSAGPEINLVERDLIASSLFVSASSPAQRLWATDLALRSRAAIAVIADASGFDLSATRRLQLAAEASGVLCLITRPAHEQSVLSASTTRWLVRTCPSPTFARRWTVSLLRCKGVQPAPKAPRLWTLERDHATRAFTVVPDLRDRPHQTQPLRLTG